MSSIERIKVEPGIWLRGKVYEITWRDALGKQRRRKVDGGITAARKALADEIAKRNGGDTPSADPRLTFGKAADEWFANHVEAYLRPQSQGCYRAALKHLRKEFGTRRMTDISPSMVAGYVRKQSGTLSGNTLKSHMSAMSAVYGYARRHLGFRGPWPGADLDARERPNADDARQARSLTSSEVRKLMDAANGGRFLYEFALATGMRQSEVLGLTWADVDLGDSPAVQVSEQLSRGRVAERERVALKNSRAPHAKRRVVIDDALKRRLAAHKLAQPQGCSWVFPTMRGTPQGQANVVRAFAKTVERAEIDSSCTMHWLRHTHGSALIAAGWNVADVAVRLGDSIDTVQSVYLHEFDREAREAQQRASLGSILAADDGSTGQQDDAREAAEAR
jgi:integrase